MTPTAPQQETLRPQFHFTAPKGWLNDPNGLVFYKGEYHLFYQHNPFGTEWGNMTWGHAVSKDLVHWQHLPNAIIPDKTGTMYSGSAVVDWENTSGFGTKENPPMILFYTAAGGKNDESKGVRFTQGLAYSADGRTFTKFPGNPIVPFIEAENRDPKVIWHKPSKSWVMALYLDGDRYAIFRSLDLKKWTKSGDVTMPGDGECPDFFELPIEGKGEKKWVFWSAGGHYRIGKFDGHAFEPETDPIASTLGPNDYAAQTFSDEPKKRRIQISWMRGGSYPNMPFNQQMTVARELKLRSTPKGLRLSILPVAELSTLRDGKVSGGSTFALEGDLFEVKAKLNRKEDAEITIGEQQIRFDSAKYTLVLGGKAHKLISSGNDLDLNIYLDRTSIEVFADQGLLSYAACFVPNHPPAQMTITQGGKAVKGVQVFKLKSALE